MADDQVTAAEPTAEVAGPPTKGPSKLLLPIVIAVSTILGGGLGVTVVAPRVIASRAAAAAGPDSTAEEAGAHDGLPGMGPLLSIENLIVNPAGAQGSRFLLVSVAIEAPSEEVGERLRGQELLVRDLVIGLLETKTMEQLGTPGIRDTIKAEIADTVGVLMGQPGRMRVLLPQFVVQ